MVPLSRNVGRKAAMQMLLTGDAIDATTALNIGLVSEIAPREFLAERTRILAQRIAEKPAAVLALGKRAFYRQIEMPLSDAYDFATQAMIDNLQQPAAKEGINAFLEKRPPNW
jgi:enoyl-CoA hydratase/carnithine racemase